MNTSSIIKKVFLPVFLASSLTVSSASIQANQNTNPPSILLDTSGLTVSAPSSVATLYRLEVRIAKPDGTVEKLVSKGEDINFNVFDLPDGNYNYETWAMATNENGKYETGLSRGRFKVASGQVYVKPAARSASPKGEEESMLQLQNTRPLWQEMLTASLDFVIPSAHAANLIATDSTPSIEFNDTTAEGSDTDGREWLIQARDEDFMIIDDSNDFGSLADPTESNFTEVFKIEALGSYTGHTKIDTAPTTNSIVIEDTGNLSFADGRMYLLKATGKLGLGTITPDTGIHVKGSGKNQLMKLENTAESTWTMGQIDDAASPSNKDGDFQINITANGNGGTTGTKLTIKDENGRVGIGTNNPTGQLHIGGTATQDIFAGMGPDLATGPALNFGYAGSSFGRGAGFFNVRPDALATGVNPSLRYATANITRMIITNAGRVGIGTLSPSSSLHVSGGNIRVTGGSFIDDGTTLDVPDYVFEDSYKLMSLTKLKEYIKIERHLPGVKSAKEVKKDGLNISLTQMTLLEKIEELTLYTLQQQEVIDAQQETIATNSKLKSVTMKLSSENSSLKERMASLEKLVTNLASGNNILPTDGKKVVLNISE